MHLYYNTMFRGRQAACTIQGFVLTCFTDTSRLMHVSNFWICFFAEIIIATRDYFKTFKTELQLLFADESRTLLRII